MILLINLDAWDDEEQITYCFVDDDDWERLLYEEIEDSLIKAFLLNVMFVSLFLKNGNVKFICVSSNWITLTWNTKSESNMTSEFDGVTLKIEIFISFSSLTKLIYEQCYC